MMTINLEARAFYAIIREWRRAGNIANTWFKRNAQWGNVRGYRLTDGTVVTYNLREQSLTVTNYITK